jgi:hypothetical protein
MWSPRIAAVGSRNFRELDDLIAGNRSTFGSSLSVTEMLSPLRDGGVVVSVAIGQVILRKVVYDDGRFHVLVEEARDRIAMTGSRGRASVTYGPETVMFVPDVGAHGVERAHQLIGATGVTTAFRQVVERMGRTRRTSAGTVSVRLTAALMADIAGERGVASQLDKLAQSPPVSSRGWSYDKGDDFQDRWAGYLRATHRSFEPVRSLSDALQAVLVLEAAWYAVAARSGAQPSCAAP